MPTIQIWLKDEELRELTKRAKELTITQYVRAAILKELKK